MAPIIVIQDKINSLFEILHSEFHSSTNPEYRETIASMLREYSKIYGKYKLYPDEIQVLFKLNRLPCKSIERTKEVLEVLLLRMERETNNLANLNSSSISTQTNAIS